MEYESQVEVNKDSTKRKKSLGLLEALSKFPQSGFGFGRGPWANIITAAGEWTGSGLVVVLLLTTGCELKILRRHFFNKNKSRCDFSFKRV